MTEGRAGQNSNKALVQASFQRWKNGTGSPFELLVAETRGISR